MMRWSVMRPISLSGCVATWTGVAGSLNDREAGNPTGNLQVAADGTGIHSLCCALVSALLALAARCRRVTRRARSGGGSHNDLALGATLRPRIGTAPASSSQAGEQILAGR